MEPLVIGLLIWAIFSWIIAIPEIINNYQKIKYLKEREESWKSFMFDATGEKDPSKARRIFAQRLTDPIHLALAARDRGNKNES